MKNENNKFIRICRIEIIIDRIIKYLAIYDIYYYNNLNKFCKGICEAPEGFGYNCYVKCDEHHHYYDRPHSVFQLMRSCKFVKHSMMRTIFGMIELPLHLMLKWHNHPHIKYLRSLHIDDEAAIIKNDINIHQKKI